MAVAASEPIWMRSFLASLEIFHEHPPKLYCDSQAAMHIAKNPIFHERTKRIKIDIISFEKNWYLGCSSSFMFLPNISLPIFLPR